MAVAFQELRPVSDDDLIELSRRNPGYQFERRRDGRLAVSPTGSAGGRRSAEVLRQLAEWNRIRGCGVVFDSSTGFALPDGSVLSPNAAFVRSHRSDALTEEEQEKFAPICPDAAFEVRSKTDSLAELREKLSAYLDNGCQLAVLIDPYERFVELWGPSRQPERSENNQTPLDPELAGFVLEIQQIFGA